MPVDRAQYPGFPKIVCSGAWLLFTSEVVVLEPGCCLRQRRSALVLSCTLVVSLFFRFCLFSLLVGWLAVVDFACFVVVVLGGEGDWGGGGVVFSVLTLVQQTQNTKAGVRREVKAVACTSETNRTSNTVTAVDVLCFCCCMFVVVVWGGGGVALFRFSVSLGCAGNHENGKRWCFKCRCPLVLSSLTPCRRQHAIYASRRVWRREKPGGGGGDFEERDAGGRDCGERDAERGMRKLVID